MNFLLYLLTKITNYHHRPFRQYPHEDDDDECNLINEMYENGLGGIREFNFVNIYDIFLGSVNSQGEESDAKRVEVSKERKCRSAEMTESEFEELKKRLAKKCPKIELCVRCSIDKGDCRLLHGWKKEGDGFRHSYPLLGKYLPDLKNAALKKVDTGG